MPQSLSSATSTPAVAAFLRGVDRRARLLALIQTGDSTAAQGALAVAARVFASEAGQWPIAQWPMQYWRLLLSVPAMGQRRVDGDQADVLPEIARLTPALRAAVLLHLVASLEDTDAAAALGLDVGSYQQRIRSALPHNPQGDLDLEVWRGWRDAAQRALGRLPETVDAVQSPPQPTRAVVAEPAPVRNRGVPRERAAAALPGLQRRARWRWLLAVALVALATLAAWALLHPRGRALMDAWRGRVHSEALPPAAPPRARFDPNDPAMDPDRALHAAPAELALAHRLPLLSWLAVEAQAPAPASGTQDAADSSVTEASTPKPVESEADVSPDPRASDREAWSEWQALTDAERGRLRDAAARFDAMPEAQRNASLARFAAESFDARRGWHLGPTLGLWWPRVAALFSFDDAAERASLLQLLRQSSPEEIDALARLAQTTPPQERVALRRALLAQPPAQRLAWMQAQLNR
ncbi:hypothetical protein [Thermomonas sp.]|uniref:hypothetical protein n=1 Tax=Thermomonas sp. TaxID=1971895 RepID=UPI002624C4DF|nr:hypothetical protein [Thermomonas sp.]